MGSLGVVTMGHQKAALEVRSTASFARVVVLLVLLCVLFLGSTATEPMIRSLVTQKAAPEAASGPAVLAIELGKPAVWGGAAGDV